MKSITDYFTVTSKSNEEVKDYLYYPRKYRDIDYTILYNEVKDVIRDNYKRKTGVCCHVEDMEIMRSLYPKLHLVEWTPIVECIKNDLERQFNKQIDYALIQYYENGNAGIGWHSDSEALNTFVVGVSFGTVRKFYIRNILSKEVTDKILLVHGDVIYMKDGFQLKYEHSVPNEPKVHDPRISLTFRQFEF